MNVTPEMKKIFEEVRDNNRRLDSCKNHDFERLETSHEKYGHLAKRTARSKFICKHCEGIVDSVAHHWYQKGIEHAKNREGH